MLFVFGGGFLLLLLLFCLFVFCGFLVVCFLFGTCCFVVDVVVVVTPSLWLIHDVIQCQDGSSATEGEGRVEK